MPFPQTRYFPENHEGSTATSYTNDFAARRAVTCMTEGRCGPYPPKQFYPQPFVNNYPTWGSQPNHSCTPILFTILPEMQHYFLLSNASTEYATKASKPLGPRSFSPEYFTDYAWCARDLIIPGAEDGVDDGCSKRPSGFGQGGARICDEECRARKPGERVDFVAEPKTSDATIPLVADDTEQPMHATEKRRHRPGRLLAATQGNSPFVCSATLVLIYICGVCLSPCQYDAWQYLKYLL